MPVTNAKHNYLPPADLELRLQRVGPDRYQLALTLRMPNSAVDEMLLQRIAEPLQIDRVALLEQVVESRSYGAALTRQLFSHQQATIAFVKARQRALGAGVPLRLRLVAETGELDDLRWETLHDPSSGEPLAVMPGVLLTRFVVSDDPAPVAMVYSDAMSALVTIAAPTDIACYGLASLSADDELRVAEAALGNLAGRHLRGVSLTSLANALIEGPAVLYLVCHGAMINGAPVIYLEDADGRTQAVGGVQLVATLRTLMRRPLLVVLASCQSAGQGQGAEARLALGPRLAEAGISAVVAMQDNISVDAVQRGFPTFFAELARHGQVDLAITAMRQLLMTAGEEWWQPALFMRLRDGRLFEARRPAAVKKPVIEPSPHGPGSLRELLERKLQHLRRARIVETDASVQFKLDVQIDEIETQLRTLGT